MASAPAGDLLGSRRNLRACGELQLVWREACPGVVVLVQCDELRLANRGSVVGAIWSCWRIADSSPPTSSATPPSLPPFNLAGPYTGAAIATNGTISGGN